MIPAASFILYGNRDLRQAKGIDPDGAEMLNNLPAREFSGCWFHGTLGQPPDLPLNPIR